MIIAAIEIEGVLQVITDSKFLPIKHFGGNRKLFYVINLYLILCFTKI